MTMYPTRSDEYEEQFLDYFSLVACISIFDIVIFCSSL